MKVHEMTNLYVGYNAFEDFRILICALDKEEAQELARDYGFDANIGGAWRITEDFDENTHFDCDYVISGGF